MSMTNVLISTQNPEIPTAHHIEVHIDDQETTLVVNGIHRATHEANPGNRDEAAEIAAVKISDDRWAAFAQSGPASHHAASNANHNA